MMEFNFAHFIAMAISAGSLLIAYLSWRDKRNIKASIEICQLKQEIAELQSDQKVMVERVKNLEHFLERLGDKLDEISKEIR